MKDQEIDHEIFADLLPFKKATKRRRSKRYPVDWEWSFVNDEYGSVEHFKTLNELLESLKEDGIGFSESVANLNIKLARYGGGISEEMNDEIWPTLDGLDPVMEYGHKTPKRFIKEIAIALK